jgi:hypothetical protein
MNLNQRRAFAFGVIISLLQMTLVLACKGALLATSAAGLAFAVANPNATSANKAAERTTMAATPRAPSSTSRTGHGRGSSQR